MTQSLQHNAAALAAAEVARETGEEVKSPVHNDMYIWNLFLLRPILEVVPADWILPIIYGFVDQAKISVFGHNLWLTVIGRRSHFFAGLVCLLKS